MDNFNMSSIIEQIALIKERMNKLQQELEELTIRAEDEKGIMTVVISGTGKIIDYEFHTTSVEVYDLESIKKALITATNLGLAEAKKVQSDKRQEIVGGLNIPDIPGLF